MYNIIQYLENNCLKMINIEDDINWEDLYVIYENEYESKMDNLEPIDNQNDMNQIPNEIENKNEEDKNYLDNDNNNNKNKTEKSGKLYYYGILIFILLLCILIYFIFRIINLRKKLSALYFDSKYNNLDYNLEVNN